ILMWLHPYAFSADWKSRGLHWRYYLNDGSAGFALLPLYVLGALSASRALLQADYAQTSLLNLLLLTSNLLICIWYVCTSGSTFLLPLVVGAFYATVLWLCLRHRTLRTDNQLRFVTIVGWLCAVVGSIAAKIQAAKAHYETLPDEGCFVVTAAARGHQSIVGSWRNSATGRNENAQLRTFRDFEGLMKHRWPKLHARFRLVYNRVGPPIAVSIRYRWQADLVFMALKPFEIVALVANRCLHTGRSGNQK
ncbi:MAG: DUF6688 family protein, partial [Planctomycetaceae bacterium]